MSSAKKFEGIIVDRVLNGSWLLDPEVDAIIQRMKAEREEEEREIALAQMMRLQAPVIKN